MMSVISFQSCNSVTGVGMIAGGNKRCNSIKVKLKCFKLEWLNQTIEQDVADINVSYLTEELLVEKRMLTSVTVQGSTSGEELALLVLDYLKAEGVNPLKMMQIQTDG